MKFAIVRKEAISYWKEHTGRSCRGFNEDISRTYECDWQNMAGEKFNNNHISIFCSIGEWASNISDILKDKSLDELNLKNSRHRPALFRYYTRFFLVASEMLTDFQDVYMESAGVDQRSARKFLSSDERETEVHEFFAYVNHVCKHKVRNIHTCNHHLPIWFEDIGYSSRRINKILLGNFKFDTSVKQIIIVPRLEYVLYLLLNSYSLLDDHFSNEDHNFEKLCSKYCESPIVK